MADERTALNTDRELWRETPDDYYSPSIHVTSEGKIGINVGGMVYVKDVREWHESARRAPSEVERQSGAARTCECSMVVPPEAKQHIGVDQWVCTTHKGRGVFQLSFNIAPKCCGLCNESGGAAPGEAGEGEGRA